MAGRREGSGLAHVGICTAVCLLWTLAPLGSPGVLSSSADPSSLIYSLFYLYVWFRTLRGQVAEGISPR